MRCVLLLIVLLLAACEETIVLGTECPPREGPCTRKQPSPGEDEEAGGATEGNRDGGDEKPNETRDAGADGPGSLDGGRTDAGPRPRDGSIVPMRDAYAPEDAGPALFPAFRNPSFELIDGGREGSLAETTPTSGGPVETAIAPWYTCRPGTSVNSSVTYGLGGNQTTVTPREGKTFLTDTIPFVALNVNGLTEELAEPLLPDQRYAFAVDLFAQPDAPFIPVSEYVLELLAADALGCYFGRRLYVSEGVSPPGEWKTICMHFTTPPESPLQPPIRSVMFQINAPGNPVNILAAMHIDNIRYDAACAYLP